MAGAYCNYCGRRCFVLRVIPDGLMKGRSFHLATCRDGMAHDLRVTGHTHDSAINPVTDPEAATRIAAEVQEEQIRILDAGQPDAARNFPRRTDQ